MKTKGKKVKRRSRVSDRTDQEFPRYLFVVLPLVCVLTIFFLENQYDQKLVEYNQTFNDTLRNYISLSEAVQLDTHTIQYAEITGEAKDYLNSKWEWSTVNNKEYVVCVNARIDNDTVYVTSANQIYEPAVFDSGLSFVQYDLCRTNMAVHSHPRYTQNPSFTDIYYHSSSPYVEVSCVQYNPNSFTCFQADYNQLTTYGDLR